MALKTDVLYLQKDRLELYSSVLNKVFEFLFVPEIVQDFDVKNSDLFESLINVFITNNKIPPSEIIVVLSDNACFIKDFVQPASAQNIARSGQADQPASTPLQALSNDDLQKDIDLFIQHVPYDKVAYVTFPLPNGLKVCATNEGFYQLIISVLKKHGFNVDYVIPGLSYGNNLTGKSVLDLAMVNFIIQSSNSVKQNNFFAQKIIQDQVKESTDKLNSISVAHEDVSEKKSNKRVFVLIGIFLVLIIVLVIVYFSTMSQSQSVSQNTVIPSTVPIVSPKIVASPSAAVVLPTPNQQEIGELTLQIINASGSDTQGEFLKEQMGKYNFKSVALQVQNSIGTTGSVIKYSANTSPAVRSLVLNEVKKITANIQVLESTTNFVDIDILIGK